MENYVGVKKEKGADYANEVARSIVISSAIAGFFLPPVLNLLTCFGEEWGWRGYLLPGLKELLGLKPAILISGVIWGLWHLPLTVMGHNYGLGYRGYPVSGILAMCCFCTVIGILFSYLFIRTGSILPSVFAHGALNGFASLGIYFTRDGGNPFIGPSVTGILSGMPFIICACIALKLLGDNPEEAKELSEEKLSDRQSREPVQRRESQEQFRR
jgi:membrane protease YdiL (CAAX protease family)